MALESAMWALGGSLVTLFGTSLLRAFQPVLVDRIQQTLVQHVARLRLKLFSRHRLGGDWHHAWYASGSSNWSDENRSRVTLYALGRFAAGVWEYSNSRWLVTLQLGDDNLILGTWKELKPHGYRGSWMGRLSLKGNEISGLYLGNSDRVPQYGVGEWIWWRVGTTRPIPPLPIIQLAVRPSDDDGA